VIVQAGNSLTLYQIVPARRLNEINQFLLIKCHIGVAQLNHKIRPLIVHGTK
jgi:hypothetical protein